MNTPRVITIVCIDTNQYTVMEGERYCDRLTWDEMLGTIAELTHPRIGMARYRMQTPDEHAAWRESVMRAGREAIQSEQNT